MIGDESPWLINLIITVSLIPILVGSLGEHFGTVTILSAIVCVFLLVTLYTVSKGQIINPPRPKDIDGEAIGSTHDNPFAVHQSASEMETDTQEDDD